MFFEETLAMYNIGGGRMGTCVRFKIATENLLVFGLSP